MTEPYTFLKYEVRDHVAFITFDSPETSNNFAPSQEWEVFDVFERSQNDDSVHVLMVTGAGDAFGGANHHGGEVFNAGVYYEQAIRFFESWLKLEKPLVAAFNGPGNLTFALLSDIVIAERHVEIKDPHVLLGIPAATGAFLWPMSAGLAKAKRHILVGDSISVDEAERIGLIAEAVDTGHSKKRATELALQIAVLDPGAVQQSKRALNEWMKVAWGPIFKHGLSLTFLHFPDQSR
jgi:enoyl-CoA hydratase